MTLPGITNSKRGRSRTIAKRKYAHALAPIAALIVGVVFAQVPSRAADPVDEPSTTQPSTQPAAEPSTQPSADVSDTSVTELEPATASTPAPTRAATPTLRSAWSAAVTAIADALVDEHGMDAVIALTNEDAVIRDFNRTRLEDITQLREKLAGMTVISARSYLETPVSIASDIAADVKDLSDLPDDVKRRLTPQDDASMKRANTTASKWMSSALMTSGSDPVGVIVLWRRPADKNETTAEHPIFLLVRGEYIDGQCKIRQIAYGDPVPASTPADTDVAGAGN